MEGFVEGVYTHYIAPFGKFNEFFINFFTSTDQKTCSFTLDPSMTQSIEPWK